jgi:hypothetical protein
MTKGEKEALAKARGVSPSTVGRWVRQGGDAAARNRVRTSASQAGRMARVANPAYGKGIYERS